MFPRRPALPHQACSRCLIDPPAEPQLLFRFVKSMLTDVGPVELWATRWRRPSAAANPQGFCWPATPLMPGDRSPTSIDTPAAMGAPIDSLSGEKQSGKRGPTIIVELPFP